MGGLRTRGVVGWGTAFVPQFPYLVSSRKRSQIFKNMPLGRGNGPAIGWGPAPVHIVIFWRPSRSRAFGAVSSKMDDYIRESAGAGFCDDFLVPLGSSLGLS